MIKYKTTSTWSAAIQCLLFGYYHQKWSSQAAVDVVMYFIISMISHFLFFAVFRILKVQMFYIYYVLDFYFIAALYSSLALGPWSPGAERAQGAQRAKGAQGTQRAQGPKGLNGPSANEKYKAAMGKNPKHEKCKTFEPSEFGNCKKQKM